MRKMATKKYPHIADKKLYAAVMFACKILKNGNTSWNKSFTNSCRIAAKYHGVDVDEVISEVRKRRAVSGKK